MHFYLKISQYAVKFDRSKVNLKKKKQKSMKWKVFCKAIIQDKQENLTI